MQLKKYCLNFSGNACGVSDPSCSLRGAIVKKGASAYFISRQIG